MQTLFQFFWTIFVIFAFFAYLMVLFQIISDLFRDKDTGGFVKAIWIVALIFLPFLTALIYLIARGKGMAERQSAYVRQAKADTDTYIRQVAGRTPAQEISEAKALLDAGTITQAEYDQIKAEALS